MTQAIRHPLVGAMMRQIAALNACIAAHAGEDCDLVLSWTRAGRLREPRLQIRLPLQFDADAVLSEQTISETQLRGG